MSLNFWLKYFDEDDHGVPRPYELKILVFETFDA